MEGAAAELVREHLKNRKAMAMQNGFDKDANHYFSPEVSFYCYCTEKTKDDLAYLLVARRHKDVEQNLMKLAVSSNMHKVMDTGVRVNPGLARCMGIAYKPTELDSTDIKKSSLTPTGTAIDVKSRTPISVAERQRDKLFLVGVEWK